MRNGAILLFSIIITLFVPSLANAQTMDDVKITTEKINDHLYVLFGRGGNIGVCAGEDGVFMIDDQYAPLSEKIAAAVKEISGESVKFLVNTHWHGDHAGGNENFAKKGAIIVAHKNVRERLSSEQFMKAFSRKVPPSPKAAWPTITFEETTTFHLNGENILIFHVHNAHTDGDGVVYFQNSNVFHMGDTYFAGRFPFIDLSSGGSINGIIEASNAVLALADDDSTIIPGHGKVSNKKELTEYRDVLVLIRDRVKKAMDDGKTLEEMKAANLTEGYEDWGTGFITNERIVDIIYTDLSR